MRFIPAFDSARVLVVGDIMLDRYWYGDMTRVSPEAPVPVVRVGGAECRLGGAANVALNVSSVGARTRLIGVIGDDEPGRAVRDLLLAAGIAPELAVSAEHPTIAKLRVISRSQQLIRLDFEKSFAADRGFDRQALLQRYVDALAETDVVICSDYDKGTLAQVAAMIDAARQRGVPVLVDPKGRDWQRYAGATMITPNGHEFESAAGSSTEPARAAEELRARLRLDALLITCGDRGMSLFSSAGHRHLPAAAREVYDVTGAGDTVIALLGAGLAAGLTFGDAAAIANVGAGIVVAKLGTATVTPTELRQAARGRADRSGVVDEPELLTLVADARAQGERLVMTNGCFDLLHPGHIAYLEAARTLGDRLIVAVNDDASVRRLKGASRPINDLDHRMQVLRGLAAVDWVVAFAQDTPARLICVVKPDVLVKGGDYREQEIAGGDCVRAAGGEVRVLDFIDGFSTGALIERLRSSTVADD